MHLGMVQWLTALVSGHGFQGHLLSQDSWCHTNEQDAYAPASQLASTQARLL